MQMVDVVIPANIVEATKLNKNELLIEVAVYLYSQERLTLEQASKLAELGRISFQKELAERGIEIHFSVEDFEDDLATLSTLGRL